MNKKHIRLYTALFLVSMLISATLVVAHADTQATTDVVYNALSPDEKNHYEINIPSSVEITEDGGTMKVSIEDGYDLESDYQVSVSLASSTWTENKYQGTAPSYGYLYDYYFKMKLQNDSSSSYALALDLTNSKGTTLVPSNNKVAVFRSDGIVSGYGDGTITFTRNTKYSTDKKYKDAGTFKGTLNFVIEGSYY